MFFVDYVTKRLLAAGVEREALRVQRKFGAGWLDAEVAFGAFSFANAWLS